MSLEPWLRFFHLLGAIIWLGGGVMLTVIGTRARESNDPGFRKEFAQMLSFIGLRVLAPAVVTVPGSGIWLILLGIGWTFMQLWVLLALGSFIVAFLIGAVYLSKLAIEIQRLTTVADANLQAARHALGHWISTYQIVLMILVFDVEHMRPLAKVRVS